MLLPGQSGINNIRFQPYRMFNSRGHNTNDLRVGVWRVRIRMERGGLSRQHEELRDVSHAESWAAGYARAVHGSLDPHRETQRASAEVKTIKAKQPTTIDEYIADFPPYVQPLLEKVRTTIRKAAPKAEETIKYQIPTFVLNGNLIHFAGWNSHIGLYPGAKPVEVFKDELAKYEISKGTVKFPLDKPIPYGLIGKITKFCVKRNLEKAAAKRHKKHKMN
jgi:uncharacterized protein YdhG (YjbR/CyaY superfamily)